MVKSSLTEDRVFNTITVVLLAIVGITAVFPLLFVLSMSVTPYAEVLKNGGFIVIPRSVTLEGYRQVLSDDHIPRAFLVTVFITVVGTAINLLLSFLMAYPLSKKTLPGRSLLLMMVLFTMLFSGGMIPTYLIVKATGILNSVWALIVPSAISAFNLLIMKSFVENLPEELFESARVDGAKEWRILFQLVVPLSVPVMLTVGLFYAVQHWNTLLSAIMYVNDRSLYPLQVVLREILVGAESLDLVEAGAKIPSETFKMAAVIISTLPMIIVYPFIQKYFRKGAMLGSVKG
ncbi:carbohydrate ABC transporter permease [Paenibacillus sp. IB182496]|uniref:Carbohydrate ABC transporter permease n=1 Tax=Paenibacillus sabuli TaxID=2772509 RepID=A0A927BXA6_9BACL|nr:carbohydrate ABC transporter permease [Paenibacillus sabuli]MBD2847596.1 carbohydrate ABC transporter permease [Paenibacillus sabuli]